MLFLCLAQHYRSPLANQLASHITPATGKPWCFTVLRWLLVAYFLWMLMGFVAAVQKQCSWRCVFQDISSKLWPDIFGPRKRLEFPLPRFGGCGLEPLVEGQKLTKIKPNWKFQTNITKGVCWIYCTFRSVHKRGTNINHEMNPPKFGPFHQNRFGRALSSRKIEKLLHICPSQVSPKCFCWCFARECPLQLLTCLSTHRGSPGLKSNQRSFINAWELQDRRHDFGGHEAIHASMWRKQGDEDAWKKKTSRCINYNKQLINNN